MNVVYVLVLELGHRSAFKYSEIYRVIRYFDQQSEYIILNQLFADNIAGHGTCM